MIQPYKKRKSIPFSFSTTTSSSSSTMTTTTTITITTTTTTNTNKNNTNNRIQKLLKGETKVPSIKLQVFKVILGSVATQR